MNALVYKKQNHAAIENVPLPHLKKGEALIRVAYAGICGSDKFIVSGKHPRAQRGLILGHEFYGVIERISTNTKKFKRGDRVVCYPLISCGKCVSCRARKSYICKNLKLYGMDRPGGMAQFVSVDRQNLMKIPSGLKDPIPALIEPLAVAIHSIRMSKFKKGDTVVILGGGPIGALIGFILEKKGAEKVIVTQRNAFRLNIIKKMGLIGIDINKDNPIKSILKITKGNGADILFECSGSKAGAEQMAKMVGVSSQIVIVSLHKEPVRVDLLRLVFNELDILGIRVYTRRDFRKTINFAQKNQKDLKKIITNISKLEEASRIFNKPSKKDMKILINCK